MTDTSADQTPFPTNDALRGLKELANSPRLLRIADTQTTLKLSSGAPSTNTASTQIVDVRELAEIVMFDATRLVAKLDEFQIPQADQAVHSDREMVAVTAVLRGGAALTFAFDLECIVGSQVGVICLLHGVPALVRL